MKKSIVFLCLVIFALCVSAQNTASLNSHPKTNLNHKPTTDQILHDGDFQEYVNGATEEIAGNEKRLASLLTKLVSNKATGGKKQESGIKKLIKDILILQAYNDELRTDLNNYLKYGRGDWKLFKKEFNHDLTELSKGLAEVRIMVYEDFIALNTK